MLKRKLMAILMCSVMALGLVACGSDDDSSKKEEKTTEAGETKETSEDKTEDNTEDESETQAEGTLKDLDKTLYLALNVMFNDADSTYYGNEVGAYVEVTGDGQYTLVFDCATDLSGAATTAGVQGIEKLTAVYIKDYACTIGELGASNLVSCDIIYDKVVVDGKELTITMVEPKNAIKSNGMFDTNDPINSWDGSAVEEVVWDKDNHVVSVDGVEHPQKIEVTFTLSNLVFK